MRALIGHDRSASAREAVALAAGLPWPPTSQLTLVRVVGGAPSDARSIQAEMEADASALAGPDRHIAVRTATGRPATALAALATELDAQLLILGSRGHSTIRSLLLGSVSDELVERAPCSVLIARGAGHEQLLVGTDGSPDATAMPHTLCAWELFRGTRASIVGVAAPGGGDETPGQRELALATRRLAARLATCGLTTSDRVAAGDPASVLVETAATEEADLVAVAHRGRSPVTELLVGSVARNVVRHAPCSVLVVRSVAGSR